MVVRVGYRREALFVRALEHSSFPAGFLHECGVCVMAIEIYKVVRKGAMGVQFETKSGPAFIDPNGLKNPQIGKIVGKKLMAYVRCEVGNGMAEVLGEATEEEVAEFEGREGQEEDRSGEGPFKFPGA
jgi:hypothetical protein